MRTDVITEFIDQALYRIRENIQKLIKCLDELDESEIWKRPNQHSNSVGNIMLHLCGNIRQYAIASLGHKKDTRERDKEFLADGDYSKEELLNKFHSILEEAISIIENISPEDLL